MLHEHEAPAVKNPPDEEGCDTLPPVGEDRIGRGKLQEGEP